MCMLIDTNLIPVIFKASNANHKKYECVLDWLLFGKAKIVVGGSKYYKEIQKKIPSFVPFLIELSKCNKIHSFNDKTIDEIEQKNISLECDPDFDDPHIIALLSVSRARIFCSEDSRSFKFVTDKKFYLNGQEQPSIVCLLTHLASKELLNDKNICELPVHDKISTSIATRIKDKINSI